MFLLAWWSCAFSSLALEPTNHISQYAHAVWTVESGQIPGAVFAIAQTGDGNLWIGTEFGLLRFDGSRFVPWHPPDGESLPDNYITALAAGRDGSLWIGTREGIAQLKSNHVENYDMAAGSGVAAIAEDHTGTVWIGTLGYKSGGLCHVVSHRLDCRPMESSAGPGVQSLYSGTGGDLWAGGLGTLLRWTPKSKHKYAGPSLSVDSISADPAGSLWVSTNTKDGVMRLVGDKFVSQAEINRNTHPRVLMHDRDGALWIGTSGQGLRHFYEGQIDDFRRSNNLSHDVILSLFEDREGTVWAGTVGGLDSFHDFAITTLSTREGLVTDFITSLAAGRNDGVWIGTPKGINYLNAADGAGHSRMQLFDLSRGLPSSSIYAMFEEKNGRLWAETSAGLVAVHNGLVSRPFTLCKEMMSLTAAAQDRDGTLWFSDRGNGLIRFNGSTADVVPWSFFQGKHAAALESDLQNGGAWLGFAEGGVAYYKPPQSPQWFSPATGLPAGGISDLHLASDHALWVATGMGLGLIRGQTISKLDSRHGLPCDQIHDLIEDGQGDLWMNTACGLVRIGRDALAAWAKNTKSTVSVKVYDSHDGMPVRAIQSGYFRRAVRSSDGKLWFTSISALAVVDPRRVRENRLPPPVQIEGITADRQTYDPHAKLMFPPRTRDIEVDYAALSFVAPPKVRYKYRLEGYDLEWKDVGARRQAVYTNLGPGDYRFQVIAANNDGVWNTRGAAALFYIQPAIYQTYWFYAFCFACAVAMLWLAYRYRLRQMENRVQLKFEAQLSERTRIARELHDTIVQNISGLALQLGGLRKTVTGPLEAKETLQELRVESEKWLGELRNSIWQLRHEHTGPLLRTALERAAREAMIGESVVFRISESNKPCPATTFVQEQLAKILQEAMRNAMRHGHAKHVAVKLNYRGRRWVHVSIRDDGSGFDPDRSSKTGHFGLATMHERAQQIGAEFKIHSEPGKGTEIEIVAPLGVTRAKSNAS